MSTTSQSLPVAFVAKIAAAEGKAEELGALLTGAVELANQETGTTVWFPDTAARDAHANGEIVAALGANGHLLGAPPEINAADVLAMKMP